LTNNHHCRRYKTTIVIYTDTIVSLLEFENPRIGRTIFSLLVSSGFCRSLSRARVHFGTAFLIAALTPDHDEILMAEECSTSAVAEMRALGERHTEGWLLAYYKN
jgi:hypothetical protein